MPELPEVETIVRGLKKQLIGKKIQTVDVYKPLVLKTPSIEFLNHVSSQTVTAIGRHGKSIFLQTQENRCIKVHLGMSGALLLRPKNYEPDPYVRLRFQLDHPTFDLYYRDVRQFGRIALSNQPFEENWGPDAWTASDDRLFTALRKKKGMIKHALMNQNVIAGLGNIYVDETLFEARIHPKKRIERLKDKEVIALGKRIRDVLRRALEAGGTTFRDYVNAQGKRGKFKQLLKVYGRANEPCLRCRTPIKKTIVASRGTHHCPNCQKKPNNK